jgi:AraC-like DNA-binding protein
MKRSPPYLVRFSSGIPTFATRLGRFVWQPQAKPVQLLFNDWDIFWVQQGAARWELKDGRILEAKADEFVLLPPYVSALIGETKSQLVFWYNHFSMRLPAVQDSYLSEELSYDLYGPGKDIVIPLTFSKKEAPAVYAAYKSTTEVKLDRHAAPWQMERSILNLIAALLDFARTQMTRNSPGILIEPHQNSDPRVARISLQIERNPIYPWSVADLARDVGISTGRLHGLFRRMCGQSVKGFIVQSRLKHALKLLKSNSDGELPSIKEVSIACGFSSQHFFSRQFKTHFRMSPLQYRNGMVLV